MGQDAAATVREIEAIRDRIDAQLEELGEALPPREQLVRRVAFAALGGLLAAATLWYLAHRFKVARQDSRVRSLVKQAILELEAEDA